MRLGTADSGETSAEGGDFTEFDARFARGGLRSFGERFGGGFVTNAEGVRRPGTRCSARLPLGIEEDAFGFGAAAIETQDILHGEEDMRFEVRVRNGVTKRLRERLLGAAPSRFQEGAGLDSISTRAFPSSFR
jgi:hypothetical protein